MNIRSLYFLYFYSFFTLFSRVNSRLFGKILFCRYFNNLLKLKSANNNTLFNNKIYNDLKNKNITEMQTPIYIILENTDMEIYTIFEKFFYILL
jgi:hypothetical protein